MKRLALVLLSWVLSTQCQPAGLQLWEAYYTGPDTNNKSWGWRAMPPTQTSLSLSSYKPHIGCAVAYRFPIAVDGQWNADSPDEHVLPPECQPSNPSADGQSWEGM